MKAGIYLRVSSDDQAQHGYSLAAQRAACLERAKALGAQEITEYADEGVSGSVLDRPGLTAMREAAGRGEIGLIVMYDPDRFARNLSHQLLVAEEIEQAGARLEFVNFEWKNTAEGKLFYSLRGAIAEYEREKIRLRTISGRTQKARQGKLPFSVAPLGYRYDPETSQIAIVEGEAPLVRRIFADYLAGGTVNSIARDLTSEGIPTRNGAAFWHRQVVRQILTNPVYMGVYYANRHDHTGVGKGKGVRERGREEWIPVSVPALIDAESWTKVQEIIRRRRAQWAKRGSIYLLSGLLRCGLCGQTMTGRYGGQRWRRQRRAQYTCARNGPGPRRSCGRAVRAEDLDELVWGQVVEWLQNPARLVERVQPEANASLVEKEVARQEQDLERVRRSQRHILTVLERELAPADEALDSLDRLKHREATLLKSIGELRRSLGESGPVDKEAAFAAAERWLRSIKTEMSTTERQKIIREFVTGITVGHDTLAIHARIPSSSSTATNEQAERVVAVVLATG